MFSDQGGGNELLEKAGLGEDSQRGIRAALCGMAVAGTRTAIETCLERTAVVRVFERMTIRTFAIVAHDASCFGREFLQIFYKEIVEWQRHLPRYISHRGR